MEPPLVQYVSTGDGTSIAFGVSGSGPPLVFPPSAHSHLEINWRQSLCAPSRRAVLEILATRFSVVQYDERGQGMSSRGLDESLSLRDFDSDIEAVLDRLNLRDLVLFGAGVAAHTAARYSAAHPDRIKAVVLMACPIAMGKGAPGMFSLMATGNWEYLLQTQLTFGLSPEEMSRGVEMLKQITTKADWEAAWRVWGTSDLTDLLPRLATPVLVLHARDFVLIPVEDSMRLAASLPNARMMSVDGSSMYGVAEQTVAAIESFLDDLPKPHKPLLEPNLSVRELEVLRLIAAGRSNQQIAAELVISLNTVQRHVSNIFAKTGTSNRTEAAAYALHNNLG